VLTVVTSPSADTAIADTAAAPVVVHRVRYHECDGQCYLFNGRYLEIADVAMTEFFRGLGWTYLRLVAEGADPSVVRAVLEFSRPVHLDELIDVRATCGRVGRSSFDIEVTLWRSGELVARAELVYVNVDVRTTRARPLPDDVAAALRGVVAPRDRHVPPDRPR
jgi:acyl-CoA thioester hydrolase